ncbi:MAG: autotransporter-associated beta strand repeat-containing protein, partial [Chthoniobacteraceae bacterium]
YSDIPVTLRLTGALKGGWSTINVALDFDGGPGVLDNGYDLQGFSPTFTPSAGNGGNVAAGTQISYNSPAQYIPGAGLASSANAQIVAGSGQHSQRLSYQSKINGVLQPAGVLNFTTTSTYSWAADSTFVPASAYATESFYVARTDGHMWAPWTKTSGIGTNGLYELQPGSLTGFTNLTIADYTGLPVLPAGYQWRAESTNKYARLYIGSIDGVQQGDGIWTNGSADQKWTTNLGPAAGTINWGGGQPSSVGHIATFNNTVTNYAGGVVNVDQPQTIGGISLTNTGGGGYNLSGSAIRLENASTSGFVTDGVSSSRTLTYTDPTINVNSGTHTIANSVVIASGDAGAANGLVVNTAPGSQLTMAGNISAGYSLGNSITKQGAGTLIAGGANSYSGATNVQAGTLNVTGSVSGTTNLNLTGGTMQLSGAGGEQVNNAATLNLAGAELAFNNAANQIETLGNLTLGMNSVLNFGALGTSGFDKFVFGTGSRTGGSLTIQNWEGNANVAGADGVNDRLIFTGNAAAASAFEIAFAGSINFIGYGAGFDTIDLGSTFEVVAVPEPTSTVLLGSIALSALIGYRQRRRSFPRKSAATA